MLWLFLRFDYATMETEGDRFIKIYVWVNAYVDIYSLNERAKINVFSSYKEKTYKKIYIAKDFYN